MNSVFNKHKNIIKPFAGKEPAIHQKETDESLSTQSLKQEISQISYINEPKSDQKELTTNSKE